MLRSLSLRRSFSAHLEPVSFSSESKMKASLLAHHWTLDPDIVYLNHGSFGACPRKVLEAQAELRDLLERQPAHFFTSEAPRRLEEARGALAGFVGCDPDDLAFVPNVTTAINSVMGSLSLAPDDEIVFTDHAYNATKNIIYHVAEQLKCVVRKLEFPLATKSPEEIAAAILSGVSAHTRLFVLDHVTSQDGIIMPLELILPRLREMGIEVLVDGAHAPGMLPLDIAQLAPAYYTGNCHKWICAPKGAGFLYVRRDLQESVRPAIISHGANSGLVGNARFRTEFEWIGTNDPTAQIVVPVAIDFMAGLLPGGWSEVMERNHTLCLLGREIIADAIGTSPRCPETMLGSLASIPLPASPHYPPSETHSALDPDPIHRELLDRHGIEVPVFCPGPKSGRMIRISAQLYNQRSDYEKLARALVALL
jgi:isopenicillin-N epimerase